MHSGFVALRNDMSMDLLARLAFPWVSEALEADIRRIVAIWHDARTRFRQRRAFPVRDLHQRRCHVRAGGDALPHLWRRPCRDSAMTARLQAYAEPCSAMPEMAEWTEGAIEEVKQRAGS